MTQRPHQFRLQQIEAILARQPSAIAEVTLALWERLAPELIVIIGEGGFRPLYNRSIRLASERFTWLAVPLTSAIPSSSSRFTGLRLQLEVADPAQALQASLAVFDSFLTTLASLIGDVLTARILQSAWPENTPNTFLKDSPQ